MRVLFITHEASRTGAPLVLLNIVRWISVHVPDWKVEVLSLKGGPFDRDFSELDVNYSVFPSGIPRWMRIAGRIVPNLADRIHKSRIKRVASGRYAIIYANSVVSLEQAVGIKQRSAAKLICHIHELPTVIRFLEVDTSLFGSVDRFIAASQRVKQELIAEFRVPAEKVEVIYETIDVSRNIHSVETDLGKVESTLMGKRTVLGVGYVHWRKGYDYFIEVARVLFSKYDLPDVNFVWLGKISDELRLIVEQDLKKLGLQDQVHFIGERENPMPYFRHAHLFLMTSREDPFPLVCLEAGSFSVPIICFDKAGGIPELIRDDAGVVVPYGDTTAMAKAVADLLGDEAQRIWLGETLAKRIPDYDVDRIVPKIVEQIRHVTG